MGPRPPPCSRVSPPQQEGFREADKYQMGEGRAARNTLPACQELLARVGAWAREGGGCLRSPRLLTSGPGGQTGTGTAAEGPAVTRSPPVPRGRGRIPCAGGTRTPPATPSRGTALPCAPLAGGGRGPAVAGTPLSSPAWHRSGRQRDSPAGLSASPSPAVPNHPARWPPGHAAAPAPPAEPAVPPLHGIFGLELTVPPLSPVLPLPTCPRGTQVSCHLPAPPQGPCGCQPVPRPPPAPPGLPACSRLPPCLLSW